MSSVFESVVKAIRDWPTLYACRTDVLHQWFCVTGNGMEWRDGVLVDEYGDPTEAEISIMLKDEDEETASAIDGLAENQYKDAQAMARLAARRHNNEVNFRRDNAELLAHLDWHNGPLGGCQPIYNPPQKISRLTDYVKMAKVPDDVQPDWLAAVREMIFAIFAAPVICEIDAHDHNIKFAAKVLTNLHQRFGSPEGTPTSLEEWLEASKNR